MYDDFIKEGRGNTRCETAIGFTRKVTIQVAPVGKVTGASLETLQIETAGHAELVDPSGYLGAGDGIEGLPARGPAAGQSRLSELPHHGDRRDDHDRCRCSQA